MAADFTLGRKELAFLDALFRLKVPYMVVGLSAAALQGAPVVTQDIDLWFKDPGDPRIKTALRKVGGAMTPPLGFNAPTFVGDAVELFDMVFHMHGLGEFSDELPNTLVIKLGGRNVRVLKLSRIIASKRAANRRKDQLVLPVLEDLAAMTASRNQRRAKPRPTRTKRSTSSTDS